MTAPDDHLDLEAAAALDEGMDEDGTLGAHVATCDECSRRVAQVRTTRALLSALPDETMPTDVSDRLRAALPREPVLTTIVPLGSRRRRLTSSPALAGLVAAAAAIALVAAISVGSLRSSDQPGDSSGSVGTAAVPRAPSTHFRVLSSGLLYTDANASGLVATLDGLVRAPVTLPATTGAQPQGLAPPKGTLSLSANQPVAPALQSLFGDRQQLLACARLLAGGPVEPLAIDFAHFTGGSRRLHNAPAMIVLLPGAGFLRDSAFIVGPHCTTDSSQDLYAFVQAAKR